MRLGVSLVVLFFLFFFFGCAPKREVYKILGNIEDPQNQIANAIAAVLNRELPDSSIRIQVSSGIGSIANLDSLESGAADFGIVDNYSKFSDQVSALMPLYPQVLHILHKRNTNPTSLRDLFIGKKIYAGVAGSGTRRFVHHLVGDLGLDMSELVFVDIFNFFDADVIFSFTDLLTQEELRDLEEYKLFSIDRVENLGRGSLADGICTRYPQFEPFVIAKDLYGKFTEEPVLTVKVDAVLVCRTDLDREFIYQVVETLLENSEDLKNINPLLFNVSADFDPRKLNFTMHRGSLDFLERHDPTFLEKNADLLSVTVSILVTLASSLYTVSRWQKAHKKNKIDIYYKKLMDLRNLITVMNSRAEIKNLEESLKSIQEETINLVIREKLLADESFSIFLNLSKIVMDEIQMKSREFEN